MANVNPVIQALCDERGITNPVEEDVLETGTLRFTDREGKTHPVPPVMNNASRLILEKFAKERGTFDTIIIDDELQQFFAGCFPEGWADSRPDHRPTLYWMKNAVSVSPDWKRDGRA